MSIINGIIYINTTYISSFWIELFGKQTSFVKQLKFGDLIRFHEGVYSKDDAVFLVDWFELNSVAHFDVLFNIFKF
jgi:hypothetical protein